MGAEIPAVQEPRQSTGEGRRPEREPAFGNGELMPFHPIPLAQAPNARGYAKSIGASAKDAQIINGVVEISVNSVLGTKTVYLQKRSGTSAGNSIASNPTIISQNSSKFDNIYSASDGLYVDDIDGGAATDVGTPDGTPNFLSACDALISGVGVIAFVTRTSNTAGSGWFLYSDAITKNFPTFSASLTSGQATAVNLASTGGIYDGQLWSGSGIPESTRVSDVINSSMVLLSANATESGSKTITKEAVSKITDAQFPTDANSIEFMDTYFFAAGDDGTIYQSSANDPSNWTAANITNADYAGDDLSFIFRWKDYIVAAGARGTVQYFQNVGSASGIVLESVQGLAMTGFHILTKPVIVNDVAYFIGGQGRADQSTLSLADMALWSLSGVNSYRRVSGEFVSGILAQLSATQMGTITSGNKTYVTAFFEGGSSVLPVYDPVNDFFTFFTLASGSVTSSYGKYFTRTGSSSSIIWAQGNTWTDQSAAYTMTAQSEIQDIANGLDVTDVWVDLLADVESSGGATLSVSDDDYQNWTTKGTFDMTRAKKRVSALGLHGPRAYRVQHSASTNFRGQILRVNAAVSAL